LSKELPLLCGGWQQQQTTGPLGTCSKFPRQLCACVVVKEVCSAIVQVLLLRYIKIPNGSSARFSAQVGISTMWWCCGWHSYSHHVSTFWLTTLTIKVGIQYLCKGWLTTYISLLMCMLDGLGEFMMPKFWKLCPLPEG